MLKVAVDGDNYGYRYGCGYICMYRYNYRHVYNYTPRIIRNWHQNHLHAHMHIHLQFPRSQSPTNKNPHQFPSPIAPRELRPVRENISTARLREAGAAIASVGIDRSERHERCIPIGRRDRSCSRPFSLERYSSLGAVRCADEALPSHFVSSVVCFLHVLHGCSVAAARAHASCL